MIWRCCKVRVAKIVGDLILYCRVWCLWLLSIEIASCHLCGVWNFEVARRFLGKLWPPAAGERRIGTTRQERPLPGLRYRYSPGICLKELKETTETPILSGVTAKIKYWGLQMWGLHMTTVGRNLPSARVTYKTSTCSERVKYDACLRAEGRCLQHFV